ncbi:MAG: hypothetical protein QGH15_15865 [Kiritimatiellia bacterium]|nr:hypothetical protein [Kiritimatiellia bacterium]
MRCPITCATALSLAFVLCLMCGCEQDSNNDAVFLDISGSWSGTYNPGDGSETSLSAAISQSDRSVFIETSLSERGHFFSGEINGEGEMFMTDHFDFEIWTVQGAVTSSRIVLIDYVEVGGSGLRHLTLTR